MTPRAKKSLGQNFLVDGNIQKKIVEALEPVAGDEVLEIGPGRGALTRHLVGEVARLVLAELDDALAAGLADRYADRSDVEVVHGDALEVDHLALIDRPDRLKIIGNIPYTITSPLLFRLLLRPRPACVVLMVQREVADRLLAPPGTRAYGALAVGVRSVASIERIWRVPRTAFRPVPRVDSTVVRITPLRPPPLSEADEHALRHLTRLTFQWRRKQMQKILRDHPDAGFGPEVVRRLERDAGWDLSQRPETFSPEEFVTMSRLLREDSSGR